MTSYTRYRRSPGERKPSGQPIELTVRGAAYGGRMIARQDDGRVVFVRGGIPAEELRADLTLEKERYAEAYATAILAPSADRSVPPCPFFGENGVHRGTVPVRGGLSGERGACGGCTYQHLDYDAQLALKREIVADLIHRQGRLPEVEVAATIPSPSPWRYRNRARWIVDDDGRPGYRQPDSTRLIAVDECHIVQPIISEVLARLSGDEWRLPLRTLVSEITIRTAVPWSDRELDPAPVVLMVLHPRPDAKRRDLRLFAHTLGPALDVLDGILAGPAPAEGGKPIPLWGADHVDAAFAGYRYRLSPLTFFQVNEQAATLLVDHVLDLLSPLAGKSILDVYAGAGTFTLPIAARAAQVVALESDPLAVDDATASARLSGLGNVYLVPGHAEEELTGLPVRAADAAVLDPPREGLGATVIDELVRIDVPRIVYVSCDPATLARDLARFTSQGYAVERVTPVDLFPQTYHVESVAMLNRA